MAVKAWAKDTFTESANTTLTSHTPEVGSTWVVEAAMTVVGGQGYVGRTSNGVANATLTGSTAVGYAVRADFKRISIGGAGCGPTIRNIQSGGNWNQVCYLLYPDQSNTVRIFRKTANAYTQLATTSKTVTMPWSTKFIAIGSSPTDLSGSFWTQGGSEPTAFDVTVSDNTAGNQTTAATPLGFYVEGTTAAGYVCDDILGVTTQPDNVNRTQAVTRAATL